MDDNHLEYFSDVLKKNSSQEGECLIWTGKTNPSGYGYLYAYKRGWVTHRISFLLHNGHLPSDLYICHKCNNKRCINPLHLYAGTAKDNWRDFRNSGNYGKSLKKSVETRKKTNEVRAQEFEQIKEKIFHQQRLIFKSIMGFDLEEMVDKIIQEKKK